MNNTPNIGKWFAGIVVTLIVGVLLWYFRSAVIYILVSAVLAIMGRPIVRFLFNIRIGKFSPSRSVSALLTLLLMWVILAVFCLVVIPVVAGKVSSLATLDLRSAFSSIQEPLERMQHYLGGVFTISEDSISLSEIMVGWLRKVLNYDTINSAFSSVVDVTLSMAVAFFSISFITFFFLKEDGLFYKMVSALFPEKYKENVTRALDKITVLLSRYFTGLLFESFILMVVITVVLLSFGMSIENAGFIGVIMGVINVIPYAGPLMGGLASVFVGIASPIDGCTIGYTIAVIVGSLLVIKGADDFILQPTLYSERVNAHPLEVFIVILVAGSVGGILGMLLAIPSYTVLRVFAKEFFSQYTLVKQLTEDI